MLSQTPIDLKNVKKGEVDKEILRLGIIAELDAISLYEQMSAMGLYSGRKETLFKR